MAIEQMAMSDVRPEVVSTDLMIGVPKQTLSSHLANLERLGQLAYGHCSLYMLQLEEGTPFYKMYKHNSDLLPSDDEVADMYSATADVLANKGFEQYEVSNYAKAG